MNDNQYKKLLIEIYRSRCFNEMNFYNIIWFTPLLVILILLPFGLTFYSGFSIIICLAVYIFGILSMAWVSNYYRNKISELQSSLKKSKEKKK